MPRPQKKYHYIYKTTCKVTGKFYVGMHSTDDLDDGYLGSGKILGYSRHKYGDENHVREILEMLPSREALKAREKEIVNEELLADPLNINLKYGGDGGWDHVHGKPLSDDHKKKIGAASRARIISDSGRKNLSHSMRGNKNSLNSARFTGKKHSEETKQKMRKPKNVGEANSQFGTCWVTNGTPIKIKKEQLDEYLLNGYRRGRK
jgi:hypothetical protein